MFRKIEFNKVIDTLERLEMRIRERFIERGLHKVCCELLLISRETNEDLQLIAKPNYWLRGFVFSIISMSIAVAFISISAIKTKTETFSVSLLIQVAESLINDLVLVSVALFFLFTLESRLKRSKILQSLSKLRAFAHVIDMHQLTKDPTEYGTSAQRTHSSPQRIMTEYELQRYLDYSSEMLSIIGKIAAVYAQHFTDPLIVSSVNEVETLTSGISRKIWQKIIIIQQREVKTQTN